MINKDKLLFLVVPTDCAIPKTLPSVEIHPLLKTTDLSPLRFYAYCNFTEYYGSNVKI